MHLSSRTPPISWSCGVGRLVTKIRSGKEVRSYCHGVVGLDDGCVDVDSKNAIHSFRVFGTSRRDFSSACCAEIFLPIGSKTRKAKI